ncbi:MAG: SpoIID/LytB domain-containing protein [Thermosediminibacteraceae bacterium]|nr:SpoIID/LytB domain-containing protein [Thermosediminibacteraceae bacterium]
MKKIFLLLLLLLVIVTSTSLGYTGAEAKLPDTIRVGLFYDKTARTSYMLTASEGFIVGIKRQNSFIPLYEVPENTLSVSITNYEQDVLTDVSAMEGLKMSGKYIEFKSGHSLSRFTLPLPLEAPLYVKSAREGGIISLNDRRYRGVIEFLPASNGGITAINELSLEEYLYGVLPNEMPPSWPIEALKAQAVAARTYAVYSILKGGKGSFDVTNDVSDQVYGGYDSEHVRTNEAVNMTKGEILTYQGEPIAALYHSNSGGITENNSDVNGTELPYLKSVKDEFSLNSPHSSWTVKIPRTQVQDFKILEKSESGRIKKLLVRGASGDKVLTGMEIRNAFQLKSTLFEIKTDAMVYLTADGERITPLNQLGGTTVISSNFKTILSEGIVFIKGSEGSKSMPVTFQYYELQGRGYGHGVGMSQWGAKVMAEKGYDYKDILFHYYKGVDLEKDFY